MPEQGSIQDENALRETLQAALRGEQLAKEKQAFQLAVLERVQDAVIGYNPEFAITYWNAAAEDLFGYTQAEALGKEAPELLKLQMPTPREEAIQMLLENGHSDREIACQRKDGTSFTGHLRTAIIPGPGGELYGFVSSIRDNTERKRAEEALAASEARYHSLFEGMTEGFGLHEIICDESGAPCDYRFLEVNPAFEQLTGLSREKVVGKRLSEILPGDNPKWIEEYGQVALHGEPVHFEDFSPGLDRYYDVFAYRPAPDQFAVIFTDITERKLAQEALRESEGKYRTLFTSVREGFTLNRAMYDADGALFDLCVIEANPAAADANGLTREDFIGKTWRELWPGAEESWREICRPVFQEGKEVIYEDYAAVHNRWYEMHHFSAGKDLLGSIFLDITTRKLAEAESRERMIQVELQHRLIEQREQERLRIARDLHDGPLQELIAAIYALQGMIYDKEASNLAGGLKAITESLQHQVTELRSYASELRPPTLAKFGLEQAIRAHAEVFQEKHPAIKVQIDAAQEGPLLPDEIRLALFRIYQEAMNNVAKHSPKARVHIHFRKDEREARLEIVDNGPGFEVPLDWLALARAGHLGLVGMRERSEAIGGGLEILSQPLRGTQIRIQVPLGPA